MNESNELLVSDDGPVRHLRFNRPERLNVIDLAQHERIIKELERAEANPDIRVIAFSGEGRAFCAGDDLNAGKVSSQAMRKRNVELDIGVGPVVLLEAAAVIRNLSKATVALMHGHTLGSGFDYSLSCDFRLAANDLNYGDPRIHRAMWAAEGWSYKLVRQLNQSMVTPICYLGETMNAEQAHSAGLIHRIYPSGVDLRRSAREQLIALAEIDPDAYRATRKRLVEGLDMSFDQAMNYSP